MPRPAQSIKLLFLLLWSLPFAATLAAQTPPPSGATIRVDASDASRRIFHAHLVIPAAPGPLVLLYPKWIPGEHGPTGPVTDLAGVRFTAGGKPIAWQRDPVDMHAFRLEVPAGAKAVEADLDYLTPTEDGNFTSGPSNTARLALLSWNTVLLYPQGKSGDELTYTASLDLPDSWKHATALPVARQGKDRVEFEPVSMTTLIDSPVLMGAYLKTLPLTGAGASGLKHQVDVAADGPESLEAPAWFSEKMSNLVAQAGALFGARHYRSYRWLLSLSDHVAHFGLEHHESSDNRMPEETLRKEELQRDLGGLLAHEYVHSWNGKYRRPAGLVDPDYNQPMQGELLWVYEGLTQYLGTILPPRSGLWTPEFFRDRLAVLTANLDHQAGRSWRPLADTAVAAQSLFGSPDAFRSWRRGTDFYDESVLIWLEADAILRRESKGSRSLDDFCRRFHGGESGAPKVVPYTFEDVVADLNAVAPYDWKGFLESRVKTTSTQAPKGGLEAAGWKLVYNDTPNAAIEGREKRNKNRDWTFSLGFQLDEKGMVRDTSRGLPADKAGIGPGMTILGVEGRRFTPERLDAAIVRAKTSKEPIDLLVENAETFKTFRLDYHGGQRYPHLERDTAKPDGLSTVIAPLAAGK